MKLNNPVVKLIEISGCSPEVFSKVWTLAKDDTPYDLIGCLPPDKLDNCMSTDIPPQEYVNTIWSIEGMPRAFWDQLDRCRLASFWEQSARVIDLSTFADEERYWVPSQVSRNPIIHSFYREKMKEIQEAYSSLVSMGVPVEEARGVIPLYVLTRGTMCINLRALKGLIRNRVCFVCQGSYWFPIVKGMVGELKKYLPPKTIRSLVNLPCEGGGHCPIEGSVLQRITGEDPNPICPLYIEKFAKESGEEELWKRAHELTPDYGKVREEYYSLLEDLGIMKGGEEIESQEST